MLLGACDSQRQAQTAGPSSGGTPGTDVPESTLPVTAPVATELATTASTTPLTTTTTEPRTTTTLTSPRTTTTTIKARTTTTTATATTTTTTARSTTSTTEPRPRSTTTTTTAPARLPGVANPKCVVQIKRGDSLSIIVEAVDDDAVSVGRLQAENGIIDPNTINAGDYLDVCVRNDIDDITGDERAPPTTSPPNAGQKSGVRAQQQKLNELFAGLGMPALTIDGDSGRLTEQQLCTARVALNLPISRADMAPGSGEEQALMSAELLSIPPTAPVSAARWVLIDQTCQIMFVGEGSSRIVFVFPTSTGEPRHETRDQSGSRVFRYDPARENRGWHDSTAYPVEADNPLNGNMYMPLYFDEGQAIHGANYVPPDPQSKGCARLPVASQDALIDWLGLRGAAEPIWDLGRINLTVNVQGQF